MVRVSLKPRDVLDGLEFCISDEVMEVLESMNTYLVLRSDGPLQKTLILRPETIREDYTILETKIRLTIDWGEIFTTDDKGTIA